MGPRLEGPAKGLGEAQGSSGLLCALKTMEVSLKRYDRTTNV